VTLALWCTTSMIYSFKVFSPGEIDLPQHLMTIGKGLDTFTVTTDDVEGLKTHLSLEGVKVLECNQLDDLAPVQPKPEIRAALAGFATQLLGGARGQDLLGSKDDDVV